MKIYTKKGDKGYTSLIGGTRVKKSDARIDAYGTVDELNSYVGLVRDFINGHEERVILKDIQDRLFTIGSLLAADPEKSRMKLPDLHEEDITVLEQEMDRMNAAMPELKHFILPGGHPTVSYCHIARCVCRNAERLTVKLNNNDKVEPMVIQYLNRLSDYLFTMARYQGHLLKAEEVVWVPRV